MVSNFIKDENSRSLFIDYEIVLIINTLLVGKHGYWSVYDRYGAVY